MRHLNYKLLFCSFSLLLSACDTEMQPRLFTPHFVLIYGSKIGNITARSVADTLEKNRSRIGNDLNVIADSPVFVHIYAHRFTYATTHGHWNTSGNMEGTSNIHLLTSSPEENSTAKIALHEFAHTVMLKMLIKQQMPIIDTPAFDRKFATFPAWLFEALAVYEARQFHNPREAPFMQRGYPSIAELNNRFKGGKIYKVGYTLIEYIIERYGKANLQKLILNYGNLQVLGTNDQKFSQQWYAFVKAKYLRH